jgi:hypothetical protein
MTPNLFESAPSDPLPVSPDDRSVARLFGRTTCLAISIIHLRRPPNHLIAATSASSAAVAFPYASRPPPLLDAQSMCASGQL